MLLSEEQQQHLQQSLQALTDEEKILLAQQQSQQKDFQWLTRNDELIREQQRAAASQQQAQQALTDAAPQLAKLQLAQPAAQLRPLWEHQQEQTARLSQTAERIVEVNTRLLDRAAQRACIRNGAQRNREQLQTEHTALTQWLTEHDRFRQWGQEIAGWRAHFTQLNRDKNQLVARAARMAELRQKLAELPESTLTAEDLATAMEQQAQSRALRQRLTALHARYQPLQNGCARMRKACRKRRLSRVSSMKR